jgi:hypothetical protein
MSSLVRFSCCSLGAKASRWLTQMGCAQVQFDDPSRDWKLHNGELALSFSGAFFSG